MAQNTRNRSRAATPTNDEQEQEQEQEVRTLSLAEASDPDTLKDTVTEDELERATLAVAQARQYRDSRDASDPVHSQPVVFVGV